MSEDEERSAHDVDEAVEGEMSEAEIDYNLMETFPASDAPSWTLGISPHKKERSKFEELTPSVNDPSHPNEIVSPNEGGYIRKN